MHFWNKKTGTLLLQFLWGREMLFRSGRINLRRWFGPTSFTKIVREIIARRIIVKPPVGSAAQGPASSYIGNVIMNPRAPVHTKFMAAATGGPPIVWANPLSAFPIRVCFAWLTFFTSIASKFIAMHTQNYIERLNI